MQIVNLTRDTYYVILSGAASGSSGRADLWSSTASSEASSSRARTSDKRSSAGSHGIPLVLGSHVSHRERIGSGNAPDLPSSLSCPTSISWRTTIDLETTLLDDRVAHLYRVKFPSSARTRSRLCWTECEVQGMVMTLPTDMRETKDRIDVRSHSQGPVPVSSTMHKLHGEETSVREPNFRRWWSDRTRKPALRSPASGATSGQEKRARTSGGHGWKTLPDLATRSEKEFCAREKGLSVPFRAYVRTRRANGQRTSKAVEGESDEGPTLLLIPRHSRSTRQSSQTHSGPSTSLRSPLSNLPSHLPLSSLLLPGTHQSLSLRGWPIAKCQEDGCDVGTQLEDGVRFLDVRLNLTDEGLVAYHGPFQEYIPFPVVLSTISHFLHLNPLETLIMCVQEEAGRLVRPEFSRAVREDMRVYMDRGEWFLENRVPSLGEVRGKAVLMSRFGGGEEGEAPWVVDLPHDPSEGENEWSKDTIKQRSDGTLVRRLVRIGWHPNRWPDSRLEGFTWDCGPRTTVSTQDWYEISGWFNVPAKFEVVRTHLTDCARRSNVDQGGRAEDDGSLMCLSFTSASSVPFALPGTVAKGFGWPRWGLGIVGVNERLRDWLLDDLVKAAVECEEGRREGSADAGRLSGIIPMDFYRTGGLVDVIHAFNQL